MAGKKDSSLKKKFIALLNKQPLARFRTKPTRYHDYRCKAAYGLSVLGPAAQPAIPGLIRLLRDPDREVRANAAFCLHHMGRYVTNAVPALIQALKGNRD